jgi:outer membrane biosynthesis protein TonB
MKDPITEEFIEALTSTDIWKKINKCDPLNEATGVAPRRKKLQWPPKPPEPSPKAQPPKEREAPKENPKKKEKRPKPWEGLGEGIETIIEFVEALKGKLISEAVNEESVNEINEILGTIESFLKKFCDS